MAGTYNWGELILERRRTVDYQFAIYESDGATGIALTTGDVVRCKVYARDGSVALDLDSAANSSNESGITIDNTTAPARATVRFAQDDVADLAMGHYYGELLVVDDSETAPADAIKRAGHGKFVVYGSASGDVGKT